MSSISLDKDTFYRRIKKLYAAWKVGLLFVCENRNVSRSFGLVMYILQAATGDSKSDDVLAKADCLVSCVGVDEDTLYSKSTALQVCFIFFRRVLNRLATGTLKVTKDRIFLLRWSNTLKECSKFFYCRFAMFPSIVYTSS